MRCSLSMDSGLMASGLMALGLCALAGCATTGANAPDAMLEVELSLFEAQTPDIVRGQRIHTAQQAVYIADLVLALQGVNMQGRASKVSYYEGVYLVTFSPGPGDPTGRYTVHINAADSEVQRVALEGRRPVARLDAAQ